MDRITYEESIIEEKPLKLFDISKYKPKEAKKKIEFEFQSLGLEMKEYFGKQKFWYLFHDARFNVKMIREAFEICKKRGVCKVNYLLGVLNNLKG